MHLYTKKSQEKKGQSVANKVSQKQRSVASTFQFVDNRPEAIAQRKLQEMMNNSHQVNQLRAFQEVANNSPQGKQAAQLQAMADTYTLQHHQPIQKKENNTGLPDNLKTGIENLSGYSMDDVKVHRNSDKPSQLQAHAYAHGTDIHLGPGQEKHLPHETWHVVQQKQGRVKPTMQVKGKVNINDDEGLEHEADVMGAKALQMRRIEKSAIEFPIHGSTPQPQGRKYIGVPPTSHGGVTPGLQLMKLSFKDLREEGNPREPSAFDITKVVIRRQTGSNKHTNHWWLYFEVKNTPDDSEWMMVDLTSTEYRIILNANFDPIKGFKGTDQEFKGKDLTRGKVVTAVTLAAMQKPQYKNYGEGERYNCQHFVWAMIEELDLAPVLGTLRAYKP